jgi:serine/threonine-protein kinase
MARVLFATDYADGGSLDEYLQRKNWDLPESYRLLGEVILGMKAIHSFNVIHGDVKPQNIVIRRNHAQVADFGLSIVRRQLTNTTGTAHARGTFSYMAPELYRGRRARSPADVYSFGILSHEILSEGRNPFAGFPETEVRGNKLASVLKAPDSMSALSDICAQAY